MKTFQEFDKSFRDILYDIASSGKCFEAELTLNQTAIILYLLEQTNLSSLTKDVFTRQFFSQTIRADVLADIILAEIECAETGV